MNHFLLKEKEISVEFENEYVMRRKKAEEEKKLNSVPNVLMLLLSLRLGCGLCIIQSKIIFKKFISIGRCLMDC